MTSSGSPYARFRRSLANGKLPMVLAAAAELPAVDLPDALAVLELIAVQDPDRYPPAAARFMQRLTSERRLTLEQQRQALAALELMPREPHTTSVLGGLIERTERSGKPTAGTTVSAELGRPERWN